MEDIYTIVDKAIDVAFEEQKFHLKFYDFMKSCKTTGIGAKEFNQSSTAKELTDLISVLSEYIKGGKDGLQYSQEPSEVEGLDNFEIRNNMFEED